MKENVEIKTVEGTTEIVIREGQAEKIIPFKPVNIEGILNSPLEYLKVRKSVVDMEVANIQIDREGLSITLTIEEDNELESKIIGNLDLTQEFVKFGINGGKSWVPRELAEHFKMNRVCFESKEVANKLVAILMDVKIKMDRVVENASGQKGNIRQLKEQTLKECNIPESLTLEMPIFKGAKKAVFNCEIWINPEDLSVKLISPDAQDIIREVRDEEIDSVISEIRTLCPELAIIET